ncbi:MAG: alginate lyase family protein [Pseudomonadaceae bacterium]|nr:alginate lyase family protein [Pseudomonadaceae bacterium]
MIRHWLSIALFSLCYAANSYAELPKQDIWISNAQVLALDIHGDAWLSVVAWANKPLHWPTLADQDSSANVQTLAAALYAIRTGDTEMRTRVALTLAEIQGTEQDATALAVSRELTAYVIAADLIQLQGDPRKRFDQWLQRLRQTQFKGRSISSTHEDRPNNWGTHAGAARIALAIYLQDEQELRRAANVFKGWLGESEGWRGFEFGETWWQPWGFRNYGINPANTSLWGHSIDGVLPDDQRRGGPFRWPPPKENYVYEALQGAVAQAIMLERQGFKPWLWGDRALLRAFKWLHEHAEFPANGDDTWMPHVINRVYGTQFPAPLPSTPGKAVGFTEWTYRRYAEH